MLSAVEILSALLPGEVDRLNIRIIGKGEDSSLRVATLGDETRNSNDEFPILRKFWGPGEAPGTSVEQEAADPPPETWVAVNCKVFQEVLRQMDGTTLDAKFYGRMKLLYLEDERGEEGEIGRSLLLTIQPITAEEASAEPVPPPAPVETTSEPAASTSEPVAAPEVAAAT
jgi:hypothetical protein